MKRISTFKCETDPTIIMASRVVWDAGVMPHRVVLRKVDDEYVVHMENLEFVDEGFEHMEFYWGHYFKGDKEAATVDYMDRTCQL